MTLPAMQANTTLPFHKALCLGSTMPQCIQFRTAQVELALTTLADGLQCSHSDSSKVHGTLVDTKLLTNYLHLLSHLSEPCIRKQPVASHHPWLQWHQLHIGSWVYTMYSTIKWQQAVKCLIAEDK